MGRLDPCIYSIRAIKDVIFEDRSLEGEALRGRAYARHKLERVATALEDLAEHRRTDIDIKDVLTRWLNRIGQLESAIDSPHIQAAYTLDCARLCHEEAELAENANVRQALVDTVSVLVYFAEWLDVYRPGVANDRETED